MWFLVRFYPMCKRILVASDTHGSIASLTAVLIWANDVAPNAAVFLGDGLGDLEKATAYAGFSCPWQKVRGNNDFGFPYHEAVVFDFEEHRFFLCHGHRYGLYSGMDTLVAAAHNNGANVALFGHTHIPFFDEVNGVLLLNPGSVGSPRSHAGATFAIIECLPGEPPKPEFWGIDSTGMISAVTVGNSLWT